MLTYFAKEHKPIVNVGQGRAQKAIQVYKTLVFVNSKHAYILLRRNTSQASTSGKVVPERQYKKTNAHVSYAQNECLQTFAEEHEPIVNIGQGRAQKATQAYKNTCLLPPEGMLTNLREGTRATRQHREKCCPKGNTCMHKHLIFVNREHA
jgi:hypothetical protein